MAAIPVADLLEESKCYTCLGLSISDALQLALLARISVGGSSSSINWGGIGGILANQADLQAALNAKQNSLGFTPLNAASNLSDVANAATARSNLGVKGLIIPFYQVGLAPPADSTTYYVGGQGQNSSLTQASTYSNAQVQVPVSGTITRVWYKIRVYTTLGSAENVAHSIRLNDTTDFAASNIQYTAQNNEGTVTGLTQAVAAGDMLAMKIVCPAWVTNPTGVQWTGFAYLE